MQFDKFIKDIVKREKASKEKAKNYAENHADHPIREHYKRYRELPQNKIRVVNKK